MEEIVTKPFNLNEFRNLLLSLREKGTSKAFDPDSGEEIDVNQAIDRDLCR